MVDVNVSYIKSSLNILEKVLDDINESSEPDINWNQVYTDLNNFESFFYIERYDYDEDYIRKRFSATYKKMNESNTVSLSKNDLDRINNSIASLKDKTYDSTFTVNDSDVKNVINTIEKVTGVKS